MMIFCFDSFIVLCVSVEVMIIGSIFGVKLIVIDSVNSVVFYQLFLVQLLISSIIGVIISIKWISSMLIWLMFF